MAEADTKTGDKTAPDVEAFRLRGFVECAHDTFDDVVDVGEITAVVAEIEHVDGFAGQDAAGELEKGHVGTAPRTVHGKKPQSGRWDPE